MSVITRPEPILIGGLEIDPYMRGVRVDGTAVHLTGREYSMLSLLASEPQRAFSQLELIRVLWDWQYDYMPHTTALRALACRLRAKLGHQFVVNVWGAGYRLVEWGGR